jgi:hypothetical protein
MEKLEKLHTLGLAGNVQMNMQNTLAQLKNLPKLEVLLLGFNRISELPNEIGNLKNLEVLWVNANEIKALPESFKQLQKLEELHLEQNPISPDWENKLKEMLPNLSLLRIDPPQPPQ